MTLRIDFADADEIARWTAVNDGVMGGVSLGGLQAGDGPTGVFTGLLSHENNGGFASIRRRIPARSLNGSGGLAVTIRGDGRTYQLRARADDAFDGTAYRALFTTHPGRWETLVMPFARFEAVFRGRLLPNAPALRGENIRQVGFLLADRQEGPFRLEIARIYAADVPVSNVQP